MFFFGLFNSITSQIFDNKLAKSRAIWVEKGQWKGSFLQPF